MRMMVIPLVLDGLGLLPRGLEKRLKGLEIWGRLGLFYSISTHVWEDKVVHTFLKSICPEVNVRSRLDFELAYYDSAVNRFNHYTTRTLPLDLVIMKRKKRGNLPCGGLWEKIKESKKREKYLVLAREMRMLWKMKVTAIAIVFSTLRTVPKSLTRGLEDLIIGGRIDIVQTTLLLRSVRILRKVIETWGDLLSPRLELKTID